MEEGLLLLPNNEGGGREVQSEGQDITWSALAFEEMKKLSWLAGPMVAVNFSTFLLQVVSLMMVGHLGELSLSSSAMAFSFCKVTGLTAMLGMASALETLSGQAYGARQYRKLGTQMLTAIFCLTIICIPLSILWIYLGRILAFIGQDPLISEEAGKFAMWLIPVLYSYAVLQPIIRYLQMQSIIFPMLMSSGATLCFHILLSWVLVYKTGLRSVGAALAMDISIWLNVGILSLYVNFKWWTYEILVLLCGLLANPELETSVLSVCLNTMITLFAIPYGLAASVSTRVSNELGAGNPRAAKLSVIVVLFLAVTEGIIVNIIMFATRHVFGYLFSSDKEVVEYVADMVPLLCLSTILDSLYGTLSGVARGCGWQHIGACINLVAYYLCGLPIAVTLGFVEKLRGKGLWIGVLSGATTQAIKARKRLLEEKSSSNKVLE